MMPLVIHRSLILGAVTLPLELGPGEKPPHLNIVPGTTTFKLAGGQHWLFALKKYKAAFEEKGKTAKWQLESSRQHMDGSEESCNQIAHWELESSHIASELEEYGFWGVSVYDEGESTLLSNPKAKQGDRTIFYSFWALLPHLGKLLVFHLGVYWPIESEILTGLGILSGSYETHIFLNPPISCTGLAYSPVQGHHFVYSPTNVNKHCLPGPWNRGLSNAPCHYSHSRVPFS
jgi:hypothetical protein